MDSAKEFCPHSVFERANAIVAHSVKQAITTMPVPQITLAHLCNRTGKLDLRSRKTPQCSAKLAGLVWIQGNSDAITHPYDKVAARLVSRDPEGRGFVLCSADSPGIRV